VLADAIIFLVETATGLFTIALLLRFYLQSVRAPYRNPLSEFLGALTNFMVRPARRFIPGLWGFDLATLVLAWIIQVLDLAVVLWLKGYQPGAAAGAAFSGILLLAAVMLVKLGLYIVMVAVLIQAVLSWVNPYTPLAPLLHSMTRPFLRVFQRMIPTVGNVDLSPLFVIVVCQLLLMVPVAYLELALSRLLG